MIGPLGTWNPPIPIEDMPKFDVTLKLCTLYKGLPHGPAHIKFIHPFPNKKHLSFEGVGVFTEGKLHMGPFTAISYDGDGVSYSQMINGRPADSLYFTRFFGPGSTRNLESLETLTDVEGMSGVSAQIKDGLYDGHGKIFLTYGRVFIGKFK